MKLSIIIPVYNQEKHLQRCLDSILNQDIGASDYEIIIINDGSKDGSLNIAYLYRNKHSNIQIYTQNNRGVGSARNKGLELSKGTYVYFIDPDDYLVKNVLNTILSNALLCDLEILTFKSKTVLEGEDKTSYNTNYIKDYDLKKKSGIEYIADNSYNNEVWWYMTKKEFLVSSGIRFIEGRWMEDAIFTARLFLESKAMAAINFDVYRHVKTYGSAMTSKEPNHYLKVIRDNANAAKVFKAIIETIDIKEQVNIPCIHRLKTKQQSFVFFMMVRILKSRIKLSEIKSILKEMINAGGYPLNSFLGKDYNRISYFILKPLFNNRYVFFAIFLMFNPLFLLRSRIYHQQ